MAVEIGGAAKCHPAGLLAITTGKRIDVFGIDRKRAVEVRKALVEAALAHVERCAHGERHDVLGIERNRRS